MAGSRQADGSLHTAATSGQLLRMYAVISDLYIIDLSMLKGGFRESMRVRERERESRRWVAIVP